MMDPSIAVVGLLVVMTVDVVLVASPAGRPSVVGCPLNMKVLNTSGKRCEVGVVAIASVVVGDSVVAGAVETLVTRVVGRMDW
jgi:hypothetical protein